MEYKFSVEGSSNVLEQLKDNAIREHHELGEALKERISELSEAYDKQIITLLDPKIIQKCINFAYLDIMLNK